MTSEASALNLAHETIKPVRRGREFLVVPGPTNVPERVLRAMHHSAMDLNNPDFIGLVASILEDIKPIFKTKHPVFLYAANGHGAWEAALVNTITPGDTVLVPETGNFSAGWRDMAERMGAHSKNIPGDWRHGIDANAVEAMLRADTENKIKAVLAVHTDTATSITSDVPAIRAAMNAANHPALLMVDAIASLATVNIEMDAWGIDVLVSASQKGLMSAPGIALVGVNDRALERSKEITPPSIYWDWALKLEPHHYRKFCGTPPEHALFGLREALNMLSEEGIDQVYARHAKLADAVRQCVAVWEDEAGMEFNALVPSERSNAVTTILLPEGFSTDQVRDLCSDHFSVAIGGGLGAHLMGRAIRIGHLGDNNEPMILGALAGIEAALKRLGMPVKTSGLPAAIDYLARHA